MGRKFFNILVHFISLTGQIFTTNYVPSIFSEFLAIYIIGFSNSPYFLYQVSNMIRAFTFSVADILYTVEVEILVFRITKNGRFLGPLHAHRGACHAAIGPRSCATWTSRVTETDTCHIQHSNRVNKWMVYFLLQYSYLSSKLRNPCLTKFIIAYVEPFQWSQPEPLQLTPPYHTLFHTQQVEASVVPGFLLEMPRLEYRLRHSLSSPISSSFPQSYRQTPVYYFK